MLSCTLLLYFGKHPSCYAEKLNVQHEFVNHSKGQFTKTVRRVQRCSPKVLLLLRYSSLSITFPSTIALALSISSRLFDPNISQSWVPSQRIQPRNGVYSKSIQISQTRKTTWNIYHPNPGVAHTHTTHPTIWYTYHQKMNENTGYTQWFWL